MPPGQKDRQEREKHNVSTVSRANFFFPQERDQHCAALGREGRRHTGIPLQAKKDRYVCDVHTANVVVLHGGCKHIDRDISFRDQAIYSSISSCSAW